MGKENSQIIETSTGFSFKEIINKKIQETKNKDGLQKQARIQDKQQEKHDRNKRWENREKEIIESSEWKEMLKIAYSTELKEILEIHFKKNLELIIRERPLSLRPVPITVINSSNENESVYSSDTYSPNIGICIKNINNDEETIKLYYNHNNQEVALYFLTRTTKYGESPYDAPDDEVLKMEYAVFDNIEELINAIIKEAAIPEQHIFNGRGLARL